MQDISKIVERTLVPHTAFEIAVRRLEQCFQKADGASEPVCIAVVGESRTGKSRVLEECSSRHSSQRGPEGLAMPVLGVETPAKPTVKGLVTLMLREVGDPLYWAGTEMAKTIRLRALMRNTGTRMVIIDEFQHFYDKGTDKVIHAVADWLKVLVDKCKVALVVAGLPSCRAVLDQNEQLAGRFLAPIIMPRFNWQVDDEREEFIGILGAFTQSLRTQFDVPELDCDEMAFRIYCATGGLMGYLTKLLRQAVWNAVDEERGSISLADLARAHEDALWSPAVLPNLPRPFDGGFNLGPSEDLLQKIRRLGTPTEPVQETVPRNLPRARSPRIGEVLCAS